jgi:IS1 family transposase/lambda repressor-like predicted transcriptional regulator
MFSMNRLPIERRAQIVALLTEGNSLRATSRIVGCSINTVTKLLADVGEACAEYQDHTLVDLPCTTVQVDEIWSFCYAKQKNVPAEHRGEFGYGDVWTWTALCADSKLVLSWLVGGRTHETGEIFLADMRKRLPNRIQLTSDGHSAYPNAVGKAFGRDIDFAQLIKYYAAERSRDARYSPPVCIGARTRIDRGYPDPAKISTSYVERQNLTMRMHMRRFTRLTNAFSKKIDNHVHAVALHFMHYNFARPHSALSIAAPHGPALKQTPAMAAGVADHIWDAEEIARLAH